MGFVALCALVGASACSGGGPKRATTQGGGSASAGSRAQAGGEGGGARDAGAAGATAGADSGAGAQAPRGGAGADAGADAGSRTAEAPCAPRPVAGSAEVHFHHIHFNTQDPSEDLAFFETFLAAPAVEFCTDAAGERVTRATRTERGWLLYTRVAEPPDPALNTYLEHVGWIHPSPTEELLRLVALGVTLYPEGRAQCAEAAAGTMACGVGGFPDYYFYLEAPSGARIEVARGPGPATAGFGHVHLIQGVDLSLFATLSDGAYANGAIDMVNHTDVSLTEDRLQSETVVDTRGKPIDHIAYSTTDLEAAKARIEAAGIDIAEDIAFRAEYGFRSFFVRSPKGVWVEMVEDSPFE